MKSHRWSLMAAVFLAAALCAEPLRAQDAQPSLEERVRALEERDASEMQVAWKGGLRLTTADGSVKLRIGGRIHSDFSFLSGDDAVETVAGETFEDGTEFRRARLYLSGTLQDQIDFKAQYDFAGGDADFKDVWIATHHALPVGKVKVGQFKEPFGLNALTSSNNITFAERALTAALGAGRSTGVQFSGTHGDGAGTWALGAFRDSDSFGDQAGDGENNVTARVTRVLSWEEDGARMSHLGLAASTRRPNGDLVTFESRPEAHLAPTVASTGAIASDRLTLLGLEGALVQGPWSAQAEYVRATVDINAGSDARFSAWYVLGSCLLTGEHRPYSRKSGAFSGVKPVRDWRAGEGGGAWELAARYSHLDLTDGAIAGGELSDWTLGVNWYLNAYSRLVLDYVRSDLDGVGDSQAFVARFQIAF